MKRVLKPVLKRKPGDIAAVSRALTILELLIAIALIGIASSIVLVSLDTILPASQKPAPLEVLRKAMDTAWYGAAAGHGKMILTYDKEANALVVHSMTATEPTVFAFDDERVQEVRFERVPDTGEGTLQMTVTTPFSQLVFSPWGGATPTIIEMDIDGTPYRYRLEPFSGGLEVVR